MQANKEVAAAECAIRSMPVALPEVESAAPALAVREQSAKFVLDFVLGLCLLLILSPLILLAALAVKLTSRGPAFYTQKRLGRQGRVFTIIKLRTMRHECEKETGPQWAKTADPRITTLGQILRSTHVDELPQLINVLRGEMSLVGPRPERPEIVADLELRIPRYRERMAVRPGLTGLAQVQLPPDTDLDSVRLKLAYDLCYIERLSLFLDLRLLVATAFVVAHLPFSGPANCLRIPAGKEIEASFLDIHPSDKSLSE